MASPNQNCRNAYPEKGMSEVFKLGQNKEGDHFPLRTFLISGLCKCCPRILYYLRRKLPSDDITLVVPSNMTWCRFFCNFPGQQLAITHLISWECLCVQCTDASTLSYSPFSWSFRVQTASWASWEPPPSWLITIPTTASLERQPLLMTWRKFHAATSHSQG